MTVEQAMKNLKAKSFLKESKLVLKARKRVLQVGLNSKTS